MADISQINSVRLANILFTSALVVLFYDHLITLGILLECLIRWVSTPPACENRNIFTDLKLSSCQSLELYHQVFQSVTQGIVTALFSLRVYALYGCRRAVLVIFMGIAIFGGGTSIASKPFNTPKSGLPHSLKLKQHGRHNFCSAESTYGDPFSPLLYEMVPLISCKIYGFQLSGAGNVMVNRIMALLNLANIISLHPLQGNFSAFVGCLSVTLMSRIVLNLHEAADTGGMPVPTPLDSRIALEHPLLTSLVLSNAPLMNVVQKKASLGCSPTGPGVIMHLSLSSISDVPAGARLRSPGYGQAHEGQGLPKS
ncbi:hypothetical protein BDP27DRAFT_1368426 [Rhodocollybia butyracea]|uniref:Uncharacterized protein n=1 Tax=Rhodocollybia butyracea TaxID=206335 RepID=A0A9P5PC81_9AGAR|nr:hypothetical protein BDP27DRAFT_1368426 [Rhodocollybia butyracea]